MNVQIKNLDMASEVQVYDNFLSETDLNKLDNLILHNDHFPYFFNDYKVDEGDEFGWHVDVNSTGSMNRWLAFFCYLSDNDEGHTTFPYQKVSTDCKKGTIVMFPPMWPWLHQGAKPVGKPKYFLGSYLHYVN